MSGLRLEENGSPKNVRRARRTGHISCALRYGLRFTQIGLDHAISAVA
jgi:hypothetical protein